MNDQSRLISVVSYITIVGWIIALLLRQNERPRSELALFHLRQSFGIMVISFAVSLVRVILIAISLGFIGNLLALALLAFWILGIMGAIQGRFWRLPFIGDWIQENFRFIN